eukprot:TRINITY_DN576_c0_g3_i1.p1 TRINITY_DN576_c0_g3~~TRINITY_DN576_c0_g3_i1.p1  ORF type:complete len:217 (-),score=24.46 TRINITY_DN576_c0_g3_i1:30-680(-)
MERHARLNSVPAKCILRIGVILEVWGPGAASGPLRHCAVSHCPLPIGSEAVFCATLGAMTQSPELLRRLLRAKDHMDRASHEDWSVARLAGISAVSAAHFARSFKDAFGVPPHRYLLSRRIERAVALLRDTDLPITEIALQTGWTSLGTFGRIFRDITGPFRALLQGRLRGAAAPLSAQPPHRARCRPAARYRPADHRDRTADRVDQPGHLWPHLS